MKNEPWKLTDGFATLDWGQKQAFVRLNSASPALHDSANSDDKPVLGVSLGEVCTAIAYVRGDDLIAAYPPTSARSTQIEAYWRVGWCRRFPGVFGAEMLLSAQTDLLGTDPKRAVCSTVTGQEMLQWSGNEHRAAGTGGWQEVSTEDEPAAVAGPCVLVRNSGGPSFVQMVHPDDSHHTRVRFADGQFTVEHVLFENELEKGVILRARIRAAWVPANNDAQVAVDLLEDLARSELPLTT